MNYAVPILVYIALGVLSSFISSDRTPGLSLRDIAISTTFFVVAAITHVIRARIAPSLLLLFFGWICVIVGQIVGESIRRNKHALQMDFLYSAVDFLVSRTYRYVMYGNPDYQKIVYDMEGVHAVVNWYISKAIKEGNESVAGTLQELKTVSGEYVQAAKKLRDTKDIATFSTWLSTGKILGANLIKRPLFPINIIGGLTVQLFACGLSLKK